jgi:hypothetical protein
MLTTIGFSPDFSTSFTPGLPTYLQTATFLSGTVWQAIAALATTTNVGSNGAPGLTAYQVWLAEGTNGTVGDFMKAITGPKGDQGVKGDKGN